MSLSRMRSASWHISSPIWGRARSFHGSDLLNLRNRLADRYTTITKHDCDLTSEQWEEFKALPPDKLEKRQRQSLL